MDPVIEKERVEAVRELDLLDQLPAERFDRIVALCRQIFDIPKVGVNLIDEDRQYTVSAVGLPLGDAPRAESMCTFTIEGPELLEVRDTLADPRFREHPATRDGVRFYAGVPLSVADGRRVGALCLVADEPRALTPGQRALLRTLADLVERELDHGDDLYRGRDLIRRLLPRSLPPLAGAEIAGACVPARHVGGDFYDWTILDDRLQLVVADVMGKGLSAALVAAGVRAVARGTSQFNDIAESVARIDRSMADDLAEIGAFVTLFTARLDPSRGTLEYVDAGHGLGFVVGTDGATRRLADEGLPLGVPYAARRVAREDRLDHGETLVVVSDGVLDAFGAVDALTAELGEIVSSAPSSRAAVDLVTAGALARRPTDDVTVVATRRRRTGTACTATGTGADPSAGASDRRATDRGAPDEA